MQNLIYFFIALGISMDAFTLAIAYGTTNIKKIKIVLLSTLVGIFHYIMPYIGSKISSKFIFLITKSNYIISFIFLLIALEMYKSRNEKSNQVLGNFLSLIIFAFTVSIDSFSVGLALGISEKNLNVAFLIFSIVSGLFTYIGLSLGNYLFKKYGNNSIFLGIIILILISIKYLFF